MATDTTNTYTYNIAHTLREELCPQQHLTLIRELWNNFESFTYTDDDVIVCTFPRSVDEMNWFMQIRAWEEFMDKNPEAQVLDLKFEEIVRDPETAINKMADFLPVPLSDKFLQDLVVASKFENMKDAPMSEELVKLFGPAAKDVQYYRKGKIGDWVNTFTVAQNELFEATYKEKMKGSKVKNIYH